MSIPLEQLKLKAALMMAAQETCEELGGHLFEGEIHFSEINHLESSSQLCIRCGQRRSLKEIDKYNSHHSPLTKENL